MKQKSHDDRMLWAQFDSLEMGTGWDDTDILKPQIMVESVYGDSHPGSYHLNQMVEQAVYGVYERGGKPAKYYATDICDGCAQGHDGMNVVLASREAIANMVEVHASAVPWDGMILASSCDKSIPAHLKAAADHGFTAIAPVDIMDADGEVSLPVKGGRHLKENFVGSHYPRYDFTVVLSHFKGHAMGGFGGAVKNISIGIASSAGKAWIHSAGKTKNAAEMWSDLPAQDDFLESMAESAKSVADHCGDRILYISVMNNLSVDCDCDAHPEEPKMGDIGILASLDPVALDKACVDMVYASPDPGKSHLIERMESRHGIHTLEHAEAIGLGSQQYRLVELK